MAKTKIERAGDMKPIILSTFDVRAILDGRKTQARRVIKPQPQRFFEVNEDPLYLYDVEFNLGRIYPKYRPDQILWVRETWLKTDAFGLQSGYMYKANNKQNRIIFENTGQDEKWKSPRFMPKEAARLFLLVKSVTPEQLQDISGFDCVREGVSTLDILENTPEKDFEEYARLQFSKIWDKQNANKGYSWRSNPWVWKIEFERTEKP